MKKTSKFLSYILRHNPGSVDVELDDQGYVEIDELCSKTNINKLDLYQIVENDDKKRFSIKIENNLEYIRANQGHSKVLSIDFLEVKDVDILYHGTPNRNVESIMNSGLKKGNRTHVHLSRDVETAKIVGSRRGEFSILKIDAKKMIDDGLKLYISENNVYLTEFVPKKYISIYC